MGLLKNKLLLGGLSASLMGIGTMVYSINQYNPYEQSPQVIQYINAKKTFKELELQRGFLLGQRKELPYLTDEISTAIDPAIKIYEQKQKIASLEKGMEIVSRDISYMESLPYVVGHKDFINRKNLEIGFGAILSILGGIISIMGFKDILKQEIKLHGENLYL